MPILDEVAAVDPDETEARCNSRVPQEGHSLGFVQGVEDAMDCGGKSEVTVPGLYRSQHCAFVVYQLLLEKYDSSKFSSSWRSHWLPN